MIIIENKGGALEEDRLSYVCDSFISPEEVPVAPLAEPF